jgi:hypothetical protein
MAADSISGLLDGAASGGGGCCSWVTTGRTPRSATSGPAPSTRALAGASLAGLLVATRLPARAGAARSPAVSKR